MAPACLFCRKSLSNQGDIYSRVIAWEKPPKKSRGSSLVLREKTGQVACHSCIVAIQHGIQVGQQEVLF